MVDLRRGVSGANVDRVVAQNRSVFQFDLVGVGVNVRAFALFVQNVDVFATVFGHDADFLPGGVVVDDQPRSGLVVGNRGVNVHALRVEIGGCQRRAALRSVGGLIQTAVERDFAVFVDVHRRERRLAVVIGNVRVARRGNVDVGRRRAVDAETGAGRVLCVDFRQQVVQTHRRSRSVLRREMRGNGVDRLFHGVFRRAERMGNAVVDGVRHVVVRIRSDRRNRQQTDRRAADFQPSGFRTAAVAQFLDAVAQVVRIFDGAERDADGAHAGNDAQGVLSDFHQFLPSFRRTDKVPQAFFLGRVAAFVFGEVFAHGVDARDGFVRRKNAPQRHRRRRVADQFRRDVGFGVFLFERRVQIARAPDKRRIFHPFFQRVGKRLQFRAGERQRRALEIRAVGFRIGQTEPSGDFGLFSAAHHIGDFGDVADRAAVIVRVVFRLLRARVEIAGGVIFDFQFRFDLAPNRHEVRQRFRRLRVFVGRHSFRRQQNRRPRKIVLRRLTFGQPRQPDQNLMVFREVVDRRTGEGLRVRIDVRLKTFARLFVNLFFGLGRQSAFFGVQALRQNQVAQGRGHAVERQIQLFHRDIVVRLQKVDDILR